MKKTLFPPTKNSYLVIASLVLLLIGIGIGILVSPLFEPRTASSNDIENAKQAIISTLKENSVEACWRVNNGANLARGKFELTYRNIRINKLANRAIVTDCSNYDTLLAKNSAGEWVETTVNIMLDNRVNPEWQKECLIEDITVDDDTVRPENSSIDEMNLAECKQLCSL